MSFFPQRHRESPPLCGSCPAENDDSSPDLEDTDQGLMALVAQGDVDAFSALVERHTSVLYRVSFRMLGDGPEAEDVVQECFARLWVSAPNWRMQGAGLVAWLHRVTMNLCLDRLRKPSPSIVDTFPDLRDEAPLQDQGIEGREARLIIEKAMNALPDHYRAALILSYYEGFPNAVCAEAMGIHIKAFESLLLRARRHFRKLLESLEFSPRDIEMLS